MLTIPTAEELEGKSVLSVSAFYGCVKRFVETVGLNPKGEIIIKKLFFFSLL